MVDKHLSHYHITAALGRGGFLAYQQRNDTGTLVVRQVNPETGEFVIYRGHHRVEAWMRKFGKDADIEIFVVEADLNNSAHLKALMLEGDASNFKTAAPN